VQRRPRALDWHRFASHREIDVATVDPRARLRRLGIGFALLSAIVAARVVSLEVVYGDAYRAEAERPIEREIALPAVRGRILAADGTVLAYDEPTVSLAVQYRWFEEPADRDWLRRTARARLSRAERRDEARLAGEQERVLAERRDLHAQLAKLGGMSLAEFDARAGDVQRRVERIAESVNRRQQEAFASRTTSDSPDADDSWSARARTFLEKVLIAGEPDVPPAHVTVTEELIEHPLCDSLSLAAVAEIEAHPDQYPATRIVHGTRRRYPGGQLAAHLLGYLGPSDGRQAGQVGIERQYESILRGTPGLLVERSDHGGRRIDQRAAREPVPGRDVVLAVQPAIQRLAEGALDDALTLRRRMATGRDDEDAGGAIVVLDVERGQVLAAASAPRFDPHDLADARESQRWLADPAKPLFDRPLKMAIPPGSVFKTLTSIALLESGTVAPDQPFECRGYWQRPDRQRCLIFKQHGIGHGQVDLRTALATSCNVYFFHFANELGPESLIDWTLRCGFGQRTGIDLPGEMRGFVPTPANVGSWSKERWSRADTQALAIGQSALAVTPLQIARLMAAVANGGRLVTPRVATGLALSESPADATDESVIVPGEQRPIEGVHASTLKAVRAGLEAVVNDPQGTAHKTADDPTVSLAGKTGTAETGAGHGDHAWFAGYAPADRPQVAFVVVLEHAGSGSETAAPIAKRLVLELARRGLLGRPQLAREN
jgi:penicillin-binding protein 2